MLWQTEETRQLHNLTFILSLLFTYVHIKEDDILAGDLFRMIRFHLLYVHSTRIPYAAASLPGKEKLLFASNNLQARCGTL